MYHPTTRVLAVLEMLQAHGRMTGSALAERLEVNVRTARRYITMLQDLGIPIEAERGRRGAYRLRPGFKLPPLMFTEDEALAVVLGLLTARRLGLTVAAPAVEGALAKIDRVLPAALRERVGAVQGVLVLNLRAPDLPPLSATVLALSTAAQQGRRVGLRYRSWRGEETERAFDPYGVVFHAASWYAVGHCHLRGGTRTFRLDRVLEAVPCGERDAFSRPDGFDSLDFILRSLAATPRTWPVIATLDTTLERARRDIPRSLATLEEGADGVVLRCSTDNLDWLAHILAGLGCDLVIHEPPELREAFHRLAARLARIADAAHP